MKILHSADWHLDSPLQGRTPEQTAYLKNALLEIPRKVAAAAAGCDLMLLSGDLFDGPCSQESLHALKSALEEVAIPVFIVPGNHDYLNSRSAWQNSRWPENVHIFTSNAIESVALPELDCRVYGAAFTAPDAPAMLEGFRAECAETYAIGIFHGDPTQASSPYCPVTTQQVKDCNLDYLALGHIHKGGSLRAGKTLCAWPGCPMGRGFDEREEKGVLMVTLDQEAKAEFLPLDTVRFFDWQCDDVPALQTMLPAVGNDHFYRITLTGESEGIDLDALAARYAHFPNLQLRDRTVPPIDLWASAGQDTLEGVYFGMLQQAMQDQDEKTCATVRLAAKISRQLLLGQEVKLP